MQATEYQTFLDAFLLIEQPRQRLGHWAQVLAALDSPLAPPLAVISAFYDPMSDQALLHVRYDEAAVGAARLGFVVEIALLAEVGMIQPAELSEAERKRFLSERLARCTIAVKSERTALGALGELVRRIKDQRAGRSTALPPPTPRAARARLEPRGDTQDPVMLVSAKGTRDDLSPTRAKDDPTLPMTRDALQQALAAARAAEAPHRHVVSRLARVSTVELASEDIDRLASAAELVVAPRSATVSQADTIYARYLRNGRWLPIRVSALSLKGAVLHAVALPRLHDHVDVALTFGPHRVLVRGAVDKVTSVRDAVSTGAASFSVDFRLDDESRRRLTTLLTAARSANVTIKPVPQRATRRFQVEWPICLGTMRGAVKAEALDVSATGMFVRPGVTLVSYSTLNFSAMLDDDSAPIAGRAKVVRHIAPDVATTSGLAPGFGLSIVDMSEADRMRWLAFLARIERRADKRVLIGAPPLRLAELHSHLAAAGYAVTGGSDPGELVELAGGDARPVDAALIDAGWLEDGASIARVESLLARHNVPFATLHGDARHARSTLDQLLEVSV